MKPASFLFIFILLNHLAYSQSSLTYREKGIASYYSRSFHGLLTANGEIFNNIDFTAAHTKLPFNTILLITNLENGKSTVVRVNDRGPFAKKRIIDLSRPAARRLGMMEDGIIEVDIQELNVIQLSKEREDVFKKNEILDVNGKAGKLKGVSVFAWDSHYLEHVLYMMINLKLDFEEEKIFLRGKGSGKARRYSIIFSDIKSKEAAKELIIKLKEEGFRNAKII